MSDAVAVSVAKAVEAMLTDAGLSQQFTPVRSYLNWEQDLSLKEEEGLSVDVALVTTEQRSELAARGGRLRYTIPIDIAVRKRLGACATNDETGRLDVEKVDELMLLVQEIEELFIPERLTTFLAAVWQDTRILVAPLTLHLRTLRQFTGIVRVTFNADKAS